MTALSSSITSNVIDPNIEIEFRFGALNRLPVAQWTSILS